MLAVSWGGANWAEVATAAGTIGIAFGVVFAGIQVRDTRKARAAEIVRELAEKWASRELIEARRFIASYQGEGSVALLTRDLVAAKDPLSDEYFLFTRYLNFWEEIGLEFCDHSGGLKIVDEMFGDLITAAWHNTWKQVIPRVWGTRTTVSGGFRRIVEKIERKRTWRRRRRRLFCWLSTPYYDTDPPGAGCVD